jgi:hypothetical protein
MIYLLAIFCSPLALLLTGKPVSALFNLILYVIAIALWATIIFFHAGFIVWLVAFVHAVMAIDNTRADRRNRRLLAAMRRD